MRNSIKNLVFGENIYVRLISMDNSDDDEISTEAYYQVKNLANDKYGFRDWTIIKSDAGKPFFLNDSKYFLSISHTDDMIAVGVCEGFSIGIDIEKIHKMSDKVIEKYYTEHEKKIISLNLLEKEKEEIKIWTLKEAYCKCIGEGMSKRVLRWDSANDSSFFHSSKCVGEYVISVCKE